MTLNIVVCGKVIPASSVTIEIDSNTKRMVRKGVTHELDPAAASLLAAAIKKQEFDLVICATESSDSYSGIVPGQIAHFLGVPPVTFAREINVEGKTITIKRQSETGFDVVESTLPALVAVSSGINEPRYPQLKGIMAAKKKEIKVYTAADLGLPADQVGEKGARERVLTIGRPPKRQAGKVVTDEGEGGKQIADFLAEIKVI
jgi:electron transfer flavoprotein beta subunit